jgi:tryptophan-rich sensory protein
MGSVNGWYAHAHSTLWSPPNIVFGPVWLVLYSIMAIAAWQVWRSPASADRHTALGLYAGQLALNAGWTPLFFIGFDVIGPIALWLAVVWIVVLNFVVLTTVVVMWRVSKSASVLMMPYWAWLLFATALSASLAVMNS